MWTRDSTRKRVRTMTNRIVTSEGLVEMPPAGAEEMTGEKYE